ncbi:hypothetical protein DL764_008552 [Monosporascus ibericus]|uniref:Sulfotransferase domain-containing protein n=1 Tax=Monosporascus ibericus TaxID=155417 RepID=A0A4Q4SZZ7_9PEZI|nr:hypothetical protein DL764_008552 [Monosporascus ibericus]
MTVNTKPIQPRYWLITSPRTASNMLVKILNLDGQGVRHAEGGGYFFLPGFIRRLHQLQNPMNTWTEEQRTEIHETQQQCFNALQDYIAKAEDEGQIIYVKEHAMFMNDPVKENEHTHGHGVGESQPLKAQGLEDHSRSKLNLTSLPDVFLKTWNPTFLIRHPALTLPSYCRAVLSGLEMDGFKRENQDLQDSEVTLRWIRSLYDFYAAHFPEGSPWPLVLDADDVMQSQELVARYAAMAGLDPEKLQFTWEKAPQEAIEKIPASQQRMLSSLLASNRVDTSKLAGNIDIAKEAIKWRSEFGEEAGAKLERLVRNAMPDYEYLRSKRLRMEQE